MEFTIDSENVQLIVKDNNISGLNSNSIEREEINLGVQSSSSDNRNELMGCIDSPRNIRYEILLKLEDYYLINNIKLIGETEEVIVKRVKFQNVNSGLWESAEYFNPDNYKEILVKDNEREGGQSLSIFSVGLTQYIKIEFSLDEGENEVLSNRTLGIPENLDHFPMSEREINELNNFIRNNKNHNQSMQNIGERKTESCSNLRDNKQVHQRVRKSIQKIVVFSQYMYMIPNSTYLLTLLNLKNNFNNLHNNKNNYHYLCSLFLTASSMIQARLFIQAWELINKLQIFMITNSDSGMQNNFSFFKILLEPNQISNHLLLSVSTDEGLKTHIPIFLTKLEIIKSVCLFEHGHTVAFLNSLKNCINIYFYNDFSGIKLNISWAKNNESLIDKLKIQNFLNENGRKLAEILILMIKDQSEIISVSTLKIIEFILDYNPSILDYYFPKIIKILLKYLFYPNLSTNENEGNNFLENYFGDKGIFFLSKIYDVYNKSSKKTRKSSLNNQTPNRTQNLSPILMKQLNYTFDTLINNIENLPSLQVQHIAEKLNFVLLNILKNSFSGGVNDKDSSESILTTNIIRLIRKLYESTNSSVIDLFIKSAKSSQKNNVFLLRLGGLNKIQSTNNFTSSNAFCNFKKFTPEEYILNLASLCINPNTIQIFKEFFQSIQSQPTNKKNSANKNASSGVNIYKKIFSGISSNSSLNNLLIDSSSSSNLSELASLVATIFEKISEDCLLFNERDNTILLFEWFTKNIEEVSNLLPGIHNFSLNSNTSQTEEFIIFYTFFLLSLTDYFFFSKNDLKSEINKYFSSKLHPQILKLLNSFIHSLSKLEEICLYNKKCLILFELIMDVLSNISHHFNSILKINFTVIFYSQYKNLLSFMSSNGIFNENIFFLLKTLPLIDLEEEEEPENFVSVVKNIFLLVLQNFSNYYSEDMFELFSMLLNKLSSHLDQELIDNIMTAIISKYNYKGNNFKHCCNKFFSVILSNGEKFINKEGSITRDYFKYVKQNILKSISQGSFYHNPTLFLEFTEKLDLYRKYLEFLKNEQNIQILLNISDKENLEENLPIIIMNKFEDLIFSDQNSIEAFLNLAIGEINTLNGSLVAKNEDFTQTYIMDTLHSKINEILIEDFEFMEILIKFLSESKKSSEGISKFSKILSTHLAFTSQYFILLTKTHKIGNSINKHLNPLQLVESYKIMTKITRHFNNIILSLKEELNKNTDLIKDVDLSPTILKLKFYKSLYECINFSEIKEPLIKASLLESMNFIEAIIIKLNEFEDFEGEFTSECLEENKSESVGVVKRANTNLYLDYFSNILIPIINFFLESNDDFQKIFGIEIILKFFDVKFEEEKGFKIIPQQSKITFPTSIWEKIIKLTDSFNYKISLFAIYVIQVLAPRADIETILKIRGNRVNSLGFSFAFNPSQYFNSGVNFHKEEEYKFIKVKTKNQEEIFMSDSELETLHNFIREKIIFNFDYKVRNTLEGHKNNQDIQNAEKNDSNLTNEELGVINNRYSNGRIDEVIDSDLNEADLENEMNEMKNNEYIDNLKVPNLEEDEDVSKKRSVKKPVIIPNPMEDNMSLEELGVFEVEGEIFDNFDEENIPVIKNIYKRKKGSAEKLKTNQKARNLLMSDHVKKGPDINTVNFSANRSESNSHLKINPEQINKSQSNIEGNIISSSGGMILSSDEEDLLPDLQLKKKNIRPLNGLRPATPPLKQGAGVNNYSNSNPSKFSQDMPLSLDKRNKRNSKTNEKKYEIKSMEELFLEEEEDKNVIGSDPGFIQGANSLPGNDNNEVLFEKDIKLNPESNQEENVNLSYEQEILNSFENLDLEDFKNYGNRAQSNHTARNNYQEDNFSNHNKYQIKIPGVDYPVLDQINEYLVKSQSSRSHTKENYKEYKPSGIKIEDYSDDEQLENDYNNIQIDDEEEMLNDNLEDNNVGYAFDDDIPEEEFSDLSNFSNSQTKKQLEILREAKAKRPPTRYGNREDQVKWQGKKESKSLQKDSKQNPININNIIKNKNKFKPLSDNKISNNSNFIQNESNNISLQGNMKQMNNTFNNMVSMTERLHSPKNRSENMNNSASVATGNSKFTNIKKNIHNLHNMHKNNAATYRYSNNSHNNSGFQDLVKETSNNPSFISNPPVPTTKVSSEFRKILKSKLTKNSDKIFANLRKLSSTNNRNDTNRSLLNTMRTMNNAEQESSHQEIMNDYNYPKQRGNTNTARENYNTKKNNYLINTNLTESKFVVSSTNKTPNFNYSNSNKSENK